MPSHLLDTKYNPVIADQDDDPLQVMNELIIKLFYLTTNISLRALNVVAPKSHFIGQIRIFELNSI